MSIEDDIIVKAGKWRVGRKVPLNVYEGDAPVCQCHTPEMAQRIVDAMNAMTKPEGPAQEPCGTCGKTTCEGTHMGTSSAIVPPTWATPAPSQPAGAREWLQREYENSNPKTTIADWYYNIGWMEGKLVELAQQTAAKDARIKELLEEVIKLGGCFHSIHTPGCPRCMQKWEHKAAERERDSLREVANRVQEAWASRQVNYEHEVVTLDFGAAQLIEDTLAALKPGKESHE